MDRLSCNVIYVNRLVDEDTLIRAVPESSGVIHEFGQSERKREHDRNLVKPLLDTFGDGMFRIVMFRCLLIFSNAVVLSTSPANLSAAEE